MDDRRCVKLPDTRRDRHAARHRWRAVAACLAFSAFLCAPAAQAAGGWFPAASMSTGRIVHTATLLANGKVLVTGGYTDDDVGRPVASVELYDPASGRWSAAASMSTVRTTHTATLLANGKVLVTGGNTTSRGGTTSAELYDPISNTWSAAASMVVARAGHTATLLASGKVLVTGGDGASSFLASAEQYDPVSDRWSAVADMSRARVAHTATLLEDGKVLVAGGYAPGTGYWAEAELYDPVSATWSPAASMSTARFAHTATLLASGKVLVIAGGGDDNAQSPTAVVELYDPAQDSWSAAPSASVPRNSHAATLLADGTVLVTGGYGGDFRATGSSELYDPVSRRWAPAPRMSTARASHTATLLSGGKVLVAGGATNDGLTYTASAELYSRDGVAPPRAPHAVGNAYSTDLGASLVVSAPGVLRNDSDPDGDVLRAVLVSGPAHGTLTLNANGSVRYTPFEDFIGVDSFRYKASDGSLQSAAETVRITIRARCGGMAATKVGTGAADTITGTAGADVIVGLGGNDTIRGLAGNDRVCGGSGADSIGGGAGDDVLIGGSGKDVLHGDVGNDRLFGGAGADTLFGDAGDDRLDGGANTPDRCQGGPGSDTVTASCERSTSAHRGTLAGRPGDGDAVRTVPRALMLDGGSGHDTMARAAGIASHRDPRSCRRPRHRPARVVGNAPARPASGVRRRAPARRVVPGEASRSARVVSSGHGSARGL
jgi:N-acetylneuraminic acid mutarotase